MKSQTFISFGGVIAILMIILTFLIILIYWDKNHKEFISNDSKSDDHIGDFDPKDPLIEEETSCTDDKRMEIGIEKESDEYDAIIYSPLSNSTSSEYMITPGYEFQISDRQLRDLICFLDDFEEAEVTEEYGQLQQESPKNNEFIKINDNFDEEFITEYVQIQQDYSMEDSNADQSDSP